MVSKISVRRDSTTDCWVAEAQVGNKVLVTATGQASDVSERDALHALASALAERLALILSAFDKTELITLPQAR